MQKIISHLWFNTQAKEAISFYTSIFTNSRLDSLVILEDTPSGDSDLLTFRLDNLEFMAINGGDFFKLNPAISLAVYCENIDELNHLSLHLNDRSIKEANQLDESIFEKEIVIEDQFGLTWHLIYDQEYQFSQKIMPHLTFSNTQASKLSEAINHYFKIFNESEVDKIVYDVKDNNSIKHIVYNLENYYFSAQVNDDKCDDGFNESFSFMVECDTQEEIDYYWNLLSAVKESEQCGWLKDQFGLSWQIVYRGINDLLEKATEQQNKAFIQELLTMKKIDIQKLKDAIDNS